MARPGGLRAILVCGLAALPAVVVAWGWARPSGVLMGAQPVPVGITGVVGAAGEGADTIRYDRDIRPILSDRCFKCHGPDPASRRAELRLDVREVAVADRKGGPAIVPGKPEASELWSRVTSTDHSEL